MKLNSVRGVVASSMVLCLTSAPAEAGAASATVRLLPKIQSPVAKLVARNTTLADRAFVSNVAEMTAFSRVYSANAAPSIYPALSTKITSQALNASEAMTAASRATAAKSAGGAVRPAAASAMEKEVQATRVLAKTPPPKPVIQPNTASTVEVAAQVNKMAGQQQLLRKGLGAPGPASMQAGAALHQLQMEAQRMLAQAQKNAANARQRLLIRRMEGTRAQGQWEAAQEASAKRFEERQLMDQERVVARKITGHFQDVRDPGVVYVRTNPNAAEGTRYYVGQSKNSATYKARRSFHDANLGVKHEYDILAIAKPGKDLNFAEESAIRAAGREKLLNKRAQIATQTYEGGMGGFDWAK
jgi:hypothetical protein